MIGPFSAVRLPSSGAVFNRSVTATCIHIKQNVLLHVRAANKAVNF